MRPSLLKQARVKTAEVAPDSKSASKGTKPAEAGWVFEAAEVAPD